MRGLKSPAASRSGIGYDSGRDAHALRSKASGISDAMHSRTAMFAALLAAGLWAGSLSAAEPPYSIPKLGNVTAVGASRANDVAAAAAFFSSPS